MAFDQALPRRLVRWVAAEPDWELVYGEQLPRVYNFFRYRLGDRAKVEDLTARHVLEGLAGARIGIGATWRRFRPG